MNKLNASFCRTKFNSHYFFSAQWLSCFFTTKNITTSPTEAKSSVDKRLFSHKPFLKYAINPIFHLYNYKFHSILAN